MTASATSQQQTPPPQKGSNSSRRGARRVPLLDVEEVATWLGVESGFVRRLIAQRRIPFFKIGKYVRFDPEDLAAWIDSQRIDTEERRRRRYRGDSS